MLSRALRQFRPGLAALREYWRPFVLIQCAALGIVIAYFTSPAFARACERVGDFKERGGVLASALAASLAGGLLPELAKLLLPAATAAAPKTARARGGDILFNLAFFAVSGATVHFLYNFQSTLFGDAPTLSVLTKKVLFDQFFFSVLWSTPFGLVAYALHEHRYNPARAWPDINPARLVIRAPSLLLPTWAFWLPMVIMVYSLPQPLQFPLFTCALAAWSLLLVLIARPAAAAAVPAGEGPR